MMDKEEENGNIQIEEEVVEQAEKEAVEEEYFPAPGITESLVGDNEEGWGSDRLFREFWSTDHIETKTDIPEIAIPDLVDLIVLADKYRSHELKSRIFAFFKLRLSKDRLSRTEAIKILSARREEELTKEARDLPG